MKFRSLRDLAVRGKRVVVREDLNVPLKDGAVGDETRIAAACETLRYLHEQGARTIVLSHLGRPDGKAVPGLSLRPVAAVLAKRLGTAVAFAGASSGPVAEAAVARLHDGDIVLLENVRFHPEEEANDPQFARELAALGDLYVNDAFGTAHRAHASTEGIASYLPAAAGFLMEAELTALAKLTQNPARPFVCAIGGAKVKDKVGVFTHLIDRVDAFVIGGGMANTFLAAADFNVGKSLRDADLAPARRILELALEKNVRFHLPTDAVVSTAFNADEDAKTVPLSGVEDDMILDIGPETAAAYAAVLRAAKTIVFNGPMGVYEKPPYRNGTRVVGEAIAEATRHGAITVVGGGDAAAAAAELGFAAGMTHVSTGGGATLEFLEGKTLPGVAALERAAREQKRERMTVRRPLIAGNWKMNKTVAEARAFTRALAAKPLPAGVDVVVAPPFTALGAVGADFAAQNVALCAQTMHEGAQGAFTGEISAPMLRELAVTYVILGHSERRASCGETDDAIARKVRAALENELTPIVAVGETRAEHEEGLTEAIVTAQTRIAFATVAPKEAARCVVAYEPIWAIGTGLSDTPANAGRVIAQIRASVPGLAEARILYGGSMKPDNGAGYLAEPEIDGGLIGGASLDAESFAALVDCARSRSAV